MGNQQQSGVPAFPTGRVDAILDTDTYNEIDDQFALAYLLRSADRVRVRGICAAPFYNSNSASPEDGMERSYEEILHLLSLAGREELVADVYRGSRGYLVDEQTPQPSEAAEAIGRMARGYSAACPLYVVAIGAITNVASALLYYPEIREKIVVVWLGGHGLHMPDTREFNMEQDIAAARVVFSCGVPLVQLPCAGVVDVFRLSRPELTAWLAGRDALCTYLAGNTIRTAESYAAGKPWSRVIWDVTAVGFLMNRDGRLMHGRAEAVRLPTYDGHYSPQAEDRQYLYIDVIHRDALMEDLLRSLTGEETV